MLLTTGYNFEGYSIKKYLGIVTSETAIGTGIFSAFDASLSDITGTRSSSYERKMESGKNVTLKKMSSEVTRLGGNAIIGIDIDYTTFTGDVIGVIASGTAVLIEKNITISSSNSIPVFSYNSTLPFNICNLEVRSSDGTDTWSSLTLKNYSEKSNIKALFVNVELEDIFGKTIMLEDVVFAFNSDSKDLNSSNFVNLNREKIRIDLLQKAYVTVKKIVFDGYHDIVPVDIEKEIKNIDLSNSDLLVLKENYGRDVVRDKKINKDSWICFCGAENTNSVNRCYRCQREFGGEFGMLYDTQEDNEKEKKEKINELLDEIVKKKNASDIYEFVMSQDKSILKNIEKNLKALSVWESNNDENKKEEALDLIISYLYK